MSHQRPRVQHGAQQSTQGWRLPEPHLLLLWAGSYLCFVFWLRADMHMEDHIVFISVYLLCLPVIFRSTTPQMLAWTGGPICGLISGMQLIDIVFDICILKGIDISDGVGKFSARRLAFLYYHTIVNASHVNAALLVIILVSFLGAFVGVGRSPRGARLHWLWLGLWMFVGTGGYLVSVVTRYQAIRLATVFDSALFDNWERVMLARLVLYASLVGSLPIMFKISTTPTVALAEKVHVN